MKRMFPIALILVVVTSMNIHAETHQVPHIFKDGELAIASQVNENFSVLQKAINEITLVYQGKIAILEKELAILQEKIKSQNDEINKLQTQLNLFQKKFGITAPTPSDTPTLTPIAKTPQPTPRPQICEASGVAFQVNRCTILIQVKFRGRLQLLLNKVFAGLPGTAECVLFSRQYNKRNVGSLV